MSRRETCTKTYTVKCRVSIPKENWNDVESNLHLNYTLSSSSVETASLTIKSVNESLNLEIAIDDIVYISATISTVCPSILLYTRHTISKHHGPVLCQFNDFGQYDSTMAHLSYVHSSITASDGVARKNSVWAINEIGNVYTFDCGFIKASRGVFPSYLKCNTVTTNEIQWTHPLENGFPPGSCLTVSGYIPPAVVRFSVNLDVTNTTDVALHFNPRFDHQCIVRNSKINNEWGFEELDGVMPLVQGRDFEIDILSMDDGYLIALDGETFARYDHRLPPHLVTQVRVWGGIEVEEIIYESKEYTKDLEGPVEVLHYECEDDAPKIYPLKNGFPPGSSVAISGFIPSTAQRFSINLDLVREEEIALHCNARFDANCIVRNSREKGHWAKEERDGPFTLAPNSEFAILINCLQKCFEIVVNNKEKYTFEHRMSPHNIFQVRVPGEVEIRRVTYESLQVVRPAKAMIWKQIGGYLSKVETCSEGVTWGIAWNNVPYVYTRGWGGDFLKKARENPSDINDMAISRLFNVVERQRFDASDYSWKSCRSEDAKDLKREDCQIPAPCFKWETDWLVDQQKSSSPDGDGWPFTDTIRVRVNKPTSDLRERTMTRTFRGVTAGPWLAFTETKLKDVSLQKCADAANISVWAINTDGEVLFRHNVSETEPYGTSWEVVTSDEPMGTISCGGNNQVWVASTCGIPYWRSGVSPTKLTGETWELVDSPKSGVITKLSVDGTTVWALTDRGTIYGRLGTSPTNPGGSHWELVDINISDDTVVDISASGTEVWCVLSSGTLLYRMAVTPETPTGTWWYKGLTANWKYISVRGCE